MNGEPQESLEASTDLIGVNRRTALGIAIMAMLLAIAGQSGNNSAEEAVHANIEASDTWAFFQAKTIRQSQFKLAVARLELELLEKGDQLVNGQGADTDIVIASVKAYINAANRLLMPAEREHPQTGDV